ncbi:ankyrin repeat domain-containing protein 49 isoform X2 [Halyomorpha halys]|uniref:ankyrin repeat domain-containing protein 49 isoform X2 n=1 Tax=Halyomorpha halys TaxID=286706 RepID=UPI0006D4E97C
MIQIGVLLLGSTMLAEMYFQNREVEILRSQGGSIGEETIEILSDNIEYRDQDRKIKEPSFNTIKNEHLADLRVCNQDGETKLHLAAAEGRIEVVRNLLEAGQEVDVRTRDVQSNFSNLYRDTRLTPLHYAAASGNVEVMRVLVDFGADVSAMTESGDTALHKAALSGQTSAVQWLLDHGADLEAKNVFGATPLSMALVNQRKEASIALLVRSKAKDVLPLGEPWPNEVQGSPMLLLLEAFMILMFRLLSS